jgi:hypothetical protein
MTDIVSPDASQRADVASQRADVIVRGLRESDLTSADSIVRSAFDTFMGVQSLFGDRDYARTRWLGSPPLPLLPSATGSSSGPTS